MGTYTTNYNLFMPSIGEQGWGNLVNGNFSTLDSTIKGLDTRTTALESADIAFDARLQPLEAGEFETVNCAGSIFANELCGKRVGIPTTTIPHNYSPTSTFSEKLDYNHSRGATTTQTYTTLTTPLEYWDLVEDGSTLTYTFKYTKCTTWTSNYIPSASVVVTNLITGATSTHTLTLGTSSVTHTLSLSPFVSVQITVTGTKDTNGNNNYSYIEISRPNVYIKPKGT